MNLPLGRYARRVVLAQEAELYDIATHGVDDVPEIGLGQVRLGEESQTQLPSKIVTGGCAGVVDELIASGLTHVLDEGVELTVGAGADQERVVHVQTVRPIVAQRQVAHGYFWGSAAPRA